MPKLLMLIIILFIAANARAQTPDSVVIKKSTLKTLNDEQYTALLNGDDIYGMSLAGELNHYPLPDKALKYKKEIDLTAVQVNKLIPIVKEFRRKKLEMGQTI